MAARKYQKVFKPEGARQGLRLVSNTGKKIKLKKYNPVNNAFDINDMPDALIREMMTGILSDVSTEAWRIFGRIYQDRTSLDGSIPRRDSQHTVPRGQNKDLGPGEAAIPHNENPGSVSYKATAQVGYGILTDEERITADHIFSEDEVNAQLAVAKRESDAAVARKGEERLESTTSNQTFDVTTDGNGDWIDKGTASTMVDDLQAVLRLVPGADTLIAGPNAVDIMTRHKQALAGINNFDGGVTDQEALRRFIQSVLRIPNVIFWDVLLDSSSSEFASSITPEYLFDDGVWVGYGTAIAAVKPNHAAQDTAEVGRTLRSRVHELMVAQYVDVPKTDADLAEMGCYIQGIAST